MEREKPKPLCWGCGYCLEGAVSKRCPECGREFDPADLKSMNMTGTPKWWRRIFILKPIGNFTLALAVLATVALGVVTRLPARSVMKLDWSFADVTFVFSPESWWDFWSGKLARSWVMAFFFCALILWGMIFAVTLVRVAGRMMLRSKHRDVMVRSPRWRRASLPAIFVLSFLMVPVGQDYRLAHQWMAQDLAPLPGLSAGPMFLVGMPPPTVTPWIPSSPDRQCEILQTGLRRFSDREYRVAALRRLVFSSTDRIAEIAREEIPGESDAKIRSVMIHILCMHRAYGDLPTFVREMRHPDVEVRAAAIDAIGILRHPAWQIPDSTDWWSATSCLNTTPPISLNPVINRVNNSPVRQWPGRRFERVELDGKYRDQIERIMLTGESALEREAAARALLQWPPENYELRAAEWGVWVSDTAGNISMIRSQLDEIPPFVHRIGNPTSEIESRVNSVTVIFKPVIHLTVSKPMVVDVETHIRFGRPWFGYPRPDDLDFSTASNGMRYVVPTFSTLDPPASMGPLDPAQVGFPWIMPANRRHGSVSGGMGSSNNILSIGLRWQSMIVTPAPMASSKLAAVPGDARFEWWNRLRKVPASYVTSCGETERFVYYDGPTQAPAPLSVIYRNNHLEFRLPVGREIGPADDSETFHPLTSSAAARKGIFVQVEKGVAKGGVFDSLSNGGFAALPEMRENPDKMLLRMLLDAGMKDEEAMGMVDVWAADFFKKEGNRFLLLMSSDDYDMFCPISIFPAPTKMVRCGVVLTEFGTAK